MGIRRLFALGVLLLLPFPPAAQAAENVPSIAVIRARMETREAALTNSISAQYFVRVKGLPGKTAWLKFCVANHTLPASILAGVSNDAGEWIEWAADCRLELSGSMLKLAVVDPRDPGPKVYHPTYQTDGQVSWIYYPGSKSATIREKPISPRTFGEAQPWLPAYLTQFPTNFVGLNTNGPTLSTLLSRNAGNKIHVESGEDGDLILEIHSPIPKSNWRDHDLVRKITLGRRVGFAPTRYVFYAQVGTEVLSPAIEARYENFVQNGPVQIPNQIVVVTSRTERQRGSMGDPFQSSDFKSFQIEELTATIDELTVAPPLDAGSLAFHLPLGTKVFDEKRERWVKRGEVIGCAVGVLLLGSLCFVYRQGIAPR